MRFEKFPQNYASVIREEWKNKNGHKGWINRRRPIGQENGNEQFCNRYSVCFFVRTSETNFPPNVVSWQKKFFKFCRHNNRSRSNTWKHACFSLRLETYLDSAQFQEDFSCRCCATFFLQTPFLHTEFFIEGVSLGLFQSISQPSVVQVER